MFTLIQQSTQSKHKMKKFFRVIARLFSIGGAEVNNMVDKLQRKEVMLSEKIREHESGSE